VGRAADVERALELLGSPAHVVTLLGPAGIGKTRLAMRVAEEGGDRFDAVCFVAAAEARSDSALVSAVAAALGDSTADVGHALAARGALLVVLDNVEQVAGAGETIAKWASVAPDARFLVTSRERLRIESEACLELGPLGEEDAASLFVSRAAITRGRYAPDDAESRAVAELVRRLDGNPLAIELAAARTTMFSAVELLARIGKRFEILTGGPRDRAPRQGSLRGAVDWSWDLLGDGERRALARCSVFRGGFSIEAADAVLGEGGAERLESLVDKSLVFRGERFALTETVREYAAEKLAELGEVDAVERHVAFYAELARACAADLRGDRGVEAAARFRAEVDNVLEAHRRLRTRDRAGAASIALALNALLAMRGPIEMQTEVLDAAVSDATGVVDALAVRALVARARVRLTRGETGAAETDAETAIEIATRTGIGTLRAHALESVGRIDLERGRAERARARVEEALALWRAAGDRAGEASALALSSGIFMKNSRLDEAREASERALALHRELGDRASMMSLLSNLGIVHHWQGRDEEAKRSYRAALEVALALGDRREESVDRLNLALLLLDDGELVEARQEFERALAIQRAAGHRQYVGNAVGALGSLDLLEGDTKSARKRFEESMSIIRELGHRRYELATHRYLGNVALEEGDLEQALASLETALAISDEVGDFASFVLGPYGATLALLGRTKEADDAFARARASLATRGEPRAFVQLEIFEAFRDLEKAPAVVAKFEKKRLDADARVALRLLSTSMARPTTKVIIGEDARWFRIGEGERVDLSKRRAPRLILKKLAEGRVLTLDEVIAAGWPGERIQPDAAAARAYTAIKTLRELGLGDHLERRDDGYLLR
jgi:predicted ATPase/Tfp pilus assembly protein PilF